MLLAAAVCMVTVKSVELDDDDVNWCGFIFMAKFHHQPSNLQCPTDCLEMDSYSALHVPNLFEQLMFS